MTRFAWIAVVVVLVATGAGLWVFSRSATGPLPAAPVALPATVPSLVDGRIAQQLQTNKAFRDDVVFLVVATVRDRCVRAEKGAMARMANRADLPILHAVSEVTAEHPDMDQPLYRFIQRQADATPCDGVLRLPGLGPDGQGIDPALYARSFPDSYFDPSRRSVPIDHGDRSLSDRADDACNSVVYTVLPLGDSDWRCAAVRSNGRLQVRRACERALVAQHGKAGGELDAAVGRAAEPEVVEAVAALPEACR